MYPFCRRTGPGLPAELAALGRGSGTRSEPSDDSVKCLIDCLLAQGGGDVRDAADLHIRAMTSPNAAGQRFLGTGPFTWMADIAVMLRQGLGAKASKVPRRIAPDPLIRLIARFDSSLRPVIGELGLESRYSTEKARRLLGWAPRPTEQSVLDCAASILDRQNG